MKIAISVEGQRGLTWARWQRLGLAVEAMEFAGLYRSDHFVDADPPDQNSLELWSSLTWLAASTQYIEFGPLVTPLSFRHPVHTARIARDLDDLSGGRLVLGVGAGWGGGLREHRMFGFDLLDVPQRFARFEEGLQVILGLLRSEQPLTFSGRYYQLEQAALLPHPTRPGGPRLLIGGNGAQRVLPLAARYADEWNSIYRTPKQNRALNLTLDELLLARGRDPRSVTRSQMKGVIFGRNQTELEEKLAGRDAQALIETGLLVGGPAQIVDQLAQLAEAGVQKVILQWPGLDDLAGLEAFAGSVLPAVRSVV
ncbi:MAG: LLM class flavin-dependent oxidoreductase [Chloroflexota bacterium]